MTSRERFTAVLGARARCRVLVEASTESEWVARHLESLGHEVIVADPGFAPMYATRSKKVKTDKRRIADTDLGDMVRRSPAWREKDTTNLVIWIFGLIIAARGGVLHITLTYVASFLLLNSARALALGMPVLPEIAPITGPMYQLFIFFMITDPRTVVRGRRRQIVVAILIAVMETLIRFAS